MSRGNRKTIVIVAANYHQGVNRMIELGKSIIQKELVEHECEVVTVPGCWELPVAVAHQCKRAEVLAVVTMGAIERGETGHGVAIARSIFPLLNQVSVDHGKPVALGIIGPNATREQIESRVEPVASEAARAVITMLRVLK